LSASPNIVSERRGENAGTAEHLIRPYFAAVRKYRRQRKLQAKAFRRKRSYVLLFRKLPSDTSKAYADDPVAKNKDDYTRARRRR
jgi:hypothetical protein